MAARVAEEIIMPVKKVKGGYKVKYPGSKGKVVKSRSAAKKVQKSQKAKGAY
jgi:hypothetical protein